MVDLKEFELYAWRSGWFLLPPMEQLDVPELLVGDGEQADFAKLGDKRTNPLKMDIGILGTGAMTDVDGKLKHDETIANQSLTEFGIPFAVFLGFGGEVEEHKNPHNAILADS